MIRIYGNSDDQIYTEVDGKRQQHDGDDETFLVGGAGTVGGCFVSVRYGVGCSIGVWRIEVSQIDEGIAVPWAMRIENAPETDHSLALVIDCPAGTPLQKSPSEEVHRG